MKKEWKIFYISLVIAILLPLLTVFSYPLYQGFELTQEVTYQWKLAERDMLTMVIVWGMFLIHLLFNIVFIIKKKKDKTQSHGFNKYNYILLFGNLGFIFLHQLQTIIWYDGLAQDVPTWTSQFSVIFLLCLVIVMLIPQRGIILGKSFNLSPSPRAMKLLYSTHGFLFLLALTYTFWFHPMVYTIGHFFGFMYMFFLFIQVSMIGTKVHTNKYWILILEIFVVFHALGVAVFVQESAIWSMFLFGFLFILFFTQIYWLRLNKKMLYGLTIGYVLVAVTYYLIFNPTMIHQILWIPIIEYGFCLVVVLLLKIFKK